MNRFFTRKLALAFLLCSLCAPVTEAFACKHKNAAMHLSAVSKENGKCRVHKSGTKKGKMKKRKKLVAAKDSAVTVLVNEQLPVAVASKNDMDAQLLSWLTFVTPEQVTPDAGAMNGCVSLNNSMLQGKHPYEEMNKEACLKLSSAIRSLNEKTGITVTGVRVTGYSAPAGSVQKSEKVAAQRLLSLKKALCESRATTKVTVEAGWISEDWDSLAVLVHHSDIPLRDAVTGIIESTDAAAGREQTLARLAGGVPYAYMKDRLYTKVERIEYVIEYKHTVSENKTTGASCDGGITPAALFATANGFAKDSKEYADLMDLGARLFPDNMEAKINGGAIALLHKDIALAHKYMDHYATTDKALGNMGVLCMLEGNKEKAELYLQMAVAAGSAQARKALAYLKK
ncbi:MAG: hypothetical protein H6Q12_375 [Bacteroidetes bacterium]|nr:hypothetical protein [Bacteroidota bacterium]